MKQQLASLTTDTAVAIRVSEPCSLMVEIEVDATAAERGHRTDHPIAIRLTPEKAEILETAIRIARQGVAKSRR